MSPVVISELNRPCLPKRSIMLEINVYTTIATMITVKFCIAVFGLPRDSHHAISGCDPERGAIDSKLNQARSYVGRVDPQVVQNFVVQCFVFK